MIDERVCLVYAGRVEQQRTYYVIGERVCLVYAGRVEQQRTSDMNDDVERLSSTCVRREWRA